MALLQIICVNIVLSGDNAVVIALAARSLPARPAEEGRLLGQRRRGRHADRADHRRGRDAKLPYLKLIGAVLLLWIAVKLLVPEDEGEDGVEPSDNLWTAIKTILIADLVMSLDNVIGVAAAAKGSMVLLILGLAIRIPLVVFGATMLMKLMDRFPIIITLGAALLGWVAGEMAVTDPLVGLGQRQMHWLHWVAPAAGRDARRRARASGSPRAPRGHEGSRRPRPRGTESVTLASR